MRKLIEGIIANKGYEVVLDSINKSITDLKRSQYEHGEIKETVRSIYFGLDDRLDAYITRKGY
jgi:hypothetical protein